MSETPTGTDRVELTDAEFATVPHLSQLDSYADARDIKKAVERLLAARVQALTAERAELQFRFEGWRETAMEYEGKLDAARVELAAANAKISKWAEDYKKLAHDCGGTEMDRQALAARCAELEAEAANEHSRNMDANTDLVHVRLKLRKAEETLDRVTAVADWIGETKSDRWQPMVEQFLTRIERDLRAALTPEGTK